MGETVSQIQPLTNDEIRALMVINDAYRQAQARAAMAREQEAEMIGLLKRKYGLDETWQLIDILTGFEQAGGKHGNDNN